MEQFVRDLRYGLRTLSRTPGFSVIVVLVMALGTGATIAMFTVVHSVLLKPLALPDSNRLVTAYEADTILKFSDNWVAGGTFTSWHDDNKTFSQLAAVSEDEVNLSAVGGQLPERIAVEITSSQALPLLGVEPAFGRLFTAEDDRWGAQKTTVLTWGFWKRRFGGDPHVIGKTIMLDAEPTTIIGVLPVWFNYPSPKTQLWLPLYPLAPPLMMESHDSHNFRVIGKLKAGVSLAAAQADLAAISFEERKQFPNGPVFNSANLRPLLDAETYEVRTSLYALFAATGCLLLIGCLNVANLLVARSASRRKELAIRTALGGSRRRLLLEQIVESVILSIAGGVLGIFLAQLALKWLVSLRPDLPRIESIHLDGAALAFSLGIAILCGIVSGLVPALGNHDQDVSRVLQESSRATSGSRSHVRLRRVLLSVEVALTVVLLIGAGLLLRSYQQLRDVKIGIPTHNMLTMSISLPDAQYKEPAKKVAFYERLLASVRALPGVHSAALTTVLPGQGRAQDDAVAIHEDPPLAQGKWLDAGVRFVDPDYFRAIGIPLLQGRYFSPDERLDRNRYAIVNETFVRDLMHGSNPIGKHVDDPNNAPDAANSDAAHQTVSSEIVGVVADVRDEASLPSRPTVFYPLYGGLGGDVVLAVRTAGNPLNFALPVQKVVAQMDPNLPVAGVLSLDEVIGKSNLSSSFDAILLATFAALSLILAAVGLYGVLSYITTQRQSEIGIRIALGAQRDQVLSLMLLDGLKPAIVGLVLGLVASVATARLIQSLLYGTQPLDLFVYVLVTFVLLSVAIIACLVPAWRASRLDPMQALRTE